MLKQVQHDIWSHLLFILSFLGSQFNTYVLLSKHSQLIAQKRKAKLLLLELFDEERGAGAEIDAEGEVEFLAAAAGGALSQPALAGFYASAQYIVAGKGVVIVGTKVGCAYSAETFAVFPDA